MRSHANTINKKVVIIYRYVPNYRKQFYEKLRLELERQNIELELIYGQPGSFDESKNDSVNINWGIRIKNKIFNIFGKEIYWQPIFSHIKDADLIIVEQASKLLINYLLILLNVLRIKRIAFWGHGKNFQQEKASQVGEWIKRILSKNVFWWFAYNDYSKKIIKQLGFPENRITSVQNAIDTEELTIAKNHFSKEDIEDFKVNEGIKGSHIGLYVGGMYYEKNLPLLFSACELIRLKIPDYEMIFIGSGKDVSLVKEFDGKYDWVHYVGPKFGSEIVPYFLIADLFLMPGLVGLAILDCFVMNVPLVTINHNNHSPEISYLEDGVNGIIIKKNDPEKYAEAIINLFRDDELLINLRKGCMASSGKYTLDNMVNNFQNGIIQALKIKRWDLDEY